MYVYTMYTYVGIHVYVFACGQEAQEKREQRAKRFRIHPAEESQAEEDVQALYKRCAHSTCMDNDIIITFTISVQPVASSCRSVALQFG